MKQIKRLISLVLTVVLLLTSTISVGMIAQASILPIDEIEAYLILNNYTADEIKAMPLSTVLSNLQDRQGNLIEIAEDAEIVWTYFKDSQGNILADEYHEIARDETVDLSYFEDTTGYTMELIVGTANQLDPNNIRYIVKVYFTNYSRDDINISFEVYSQTEDSRFYMEPLDINVVKKDESDIVDANGQPVPRYTAIYRVEEGSYFSPHLGLRISVEERPDIGVEIYELTDTAMENPITEQILNQQMSEWNAGYAMTEASASFIVKYLIKGADGNIYIDLQIVDILVSGSFVHVEGDLLSSENGQKTSVVYEATETIEFDDTPDEETNAFYDVSVFTYELLQNAPANQEYYLNLYPYNGENGLAEYVEKAVVGHYESLEEASGQPDIKDELLSADSGYLADYSGDGVDFTLFFEEGTIDGTTVYQMTIKAIDSRNMMPAFDDAPIVGAKDPYFRVDGAISGDKELDVYVVENGKNINMDTMYGYGYQTIFINDKDVNLNALKPTFFLGDAERVDAYVSTLQTSGESLQDFSNGSVAYNTIIDERTKNYVVTFVKKESGAKLFVNGPSTRTIFLDEYFEEKHDILIANVGDKPLTGIQVTLDAVNVKLDDYWTVGGENNSTLAAFETTQVTSEYGELANIAKIRLLKPDDSELVGDGEVSGTLTISADGQTDVVIELTGRAANPTITTTELADAVLYVPYSYVVATNNMNDWNDVTFSIESGDLPKGLELSSTTGEIYGVPMETGTFDLEIKASYSRRI